MRKSIDDRIKQVVQAEKKQRNQLIENIANMVEGLESTVYCECDNYCSCSSGMIYPSEAAEAIRKLKEKV